MQAHVQASGSGTPVVMLHSGGMSSRQWARLAARLAPRYRALALDFLGVGQSPAAGPAFSVADDLAEVLALVDAQSEPVHLVGHSYGGVMALWVALARPDRVRSLSLCEPVAFGVLHSTGDAEGLAEVGGDPSFGEEGGSEAWLRAFIGYWNGPGAWDALPAPAREAFVRAGRKVFLEVVGINGDRTTHEAYGAIEAPTLLLCGARTTAAARHVAAILARSLPRAELYEIEGAGHMAPLTHADVVNARIERFLDAR